MKTLIKKLLALTPYRIIRAGKPNRFEALDDALANLSQRGYRPRRILDAGANVGEFAGNALRNFPDATAHVIEPQPGCQPALQKLAAQCSPRIVCHAVALCSPANDGKMLRMATDLTSQSTGAHIYADGERSGEHSIEVVGRTLDSILEPHLQKDDQALLKLDLQGFELEALKGASRTLRCTDVVLTEASFYAQAYEPPILDLMQFLRLNEFELHDVCSLYSRPRDERARQADLLFVRRDCALAADRSWS